MRGFNAAVTTVEVRTAACVPARDRHVQGNDDAGMRKAAFKLIVSH